jgi:hypothetical protein
VDLNDPSALHSLLVNLCNSSSFRSVFRVFQSSSRSMELLPPVATTTVSKVNFRPVPTRCTDLHLFDKLWTEAQPPIVYGDVEDPLPDLTDKAASGKGGAGAAAATAAALAAVDDRADDGSGSGGIRKCFEDVVDGGIPVADELRKCLLDRDSEHFELFTPAERNELLFVLLTHLCVGGGLCQYENSVGPYLSVLRLLYRDLVSVRTNRNTDALEVASIVLRVSNFVVTATQGTAATERILPLFGDKDKDKHHLCLFSIDPQRQHITSYYFAHTSAW